MGKRESYAPGTFSWVELTTTDAASAKAFYSSVLGWELLDNPVGDGMTYTMCLLDGEPVAALYERADVPAGWLSYVTVASADEAAHRASELGGKAGEPFDVLDAGRMALVEDPQGAPFAIWEPRAHSGAARVNDPGCFCWNHLRTPDLDAARAFYPALLGWAIDEDGTITVGGTQNGHIGGMPPGTDRAGWAVWFTVASLDDAVAAVEAGGGEIVVAKTPNPVGHYVVARDPQGAAAFLFEGTVDD
jgi:uncharacterized protein